MTTITLFLFLWTEGYVFNRVCLLLVILVHRPTVVPLFEFGPSRIIVCNKIKQKGSCTVGLFEFNRPHFLLFFFCKKLGWRLNLCLSVTQKVKVISWSATFKPIKVNFPHHRSVWDNAHSTPSLTWRVQVVCISTSIAFPIDRCLVKFPPLTGLGTTPYCEQQVYTNNW